MWKRVLLGSLPVNGRLSGVVMVAGAQIPLPGPIAGRPAPSPVADDE